MSPPQALTGLLFALCSLPLQAQECREDIPPSTIQERFEPLPGGILLDRQGNLQWQRCAIGQHWDGKTCEGQAARLDLTAAARSGIDGWRLPSLPELSSIVELRCRQPAIDVGLFPGTPPGSFWAATPFATPNEDGPRYWQVQFVYGETSLGKVRDTAFVRLVRDLN